MAAGNDRTDLADLFSSARARETNGALLAVRPVPAGSRSPADLREALSRATKDRPGAVLHPLGGAAIGCIVPSCSAPEARATAEAIRRALAPGAAAVGIADFYEFFTADGSPAEIADEIERTARHRLEAAAGGASGGVCDPTDVEAPRTERRPAVFVIEPDPVSVELLSAALDAAGFEVFTFQNGEAAAASLEASPPSLVICEAMTPRLNGFVIRERLRASPRLDGDPVHPRLAPQDRGHDPPRGGGGHPPLLPQAALDRRDRGPRGEPHAGPLPVIAWGPAGWLFAAAAAIDLVAVVAFLAVPVRRRREARRRSRARALLAAHGPGRDRGRDSAVDRFVRRHRWLFLEECARIADAVEPSPADRAWLRDVLVANRLDARLARDLAARDPFRRMRAAVRIPLAPTPGLLTALVRALETERSRSVKLFMAAGLAAAGEGAAIPSVVDALRGEPAWFQRRIAALLARLGDEMTSFVPMLADRPEKEIQLLLIQVAGRHPSTVLRDYLVARVDSGDRDIAHAAFRALTAAYAGSVDHARWLAHDDFLVRNLAAESLGGLPTARSLGLLFDRADDPVIGRSMVLAVTNILRARPQHVRTAMIRCLNEARPVARAVLADVLAGFVDDLAARFAAGEEAAGEALKEIVRHGRVTELITFLNRNPDRDLERRVLPLLADLLAADARHADELARYLEARIAARLGLAPAPPPPPVPVRREHPRLALLYAFLAVGLAAVPALCLAAAALGAAPGTPIAAGLFPRWLAAFNAAFAVYAASLNGSYLLLLAFSIAGARAEARTSALLGETLLFTRNLLPSVSIISPAFDEEASIVQSVGALLDLRYPEFEVIVVNDGSRDRTLERLVEHFGLERTEVFIHRYLATQDIRAVWASRRHPGLLVIDKANGGKADALNAGINAARKDYFAGIDADSLLERDALLALAGRFLFSDEEVVAAGGNIMPVNGCTVRRGDLVETRIPRRSLARFQAVEYLRAFMAGRIGWAAMRSLLIISGAFGVFHRRRVVDAHGYLTRSEHYLKDTVGEDMELVVRLTRNLCENRTPFAVQYASQANCWTEVPETFRVLNRQRDRWQRGLLDIMTFHSKILANPVYGRAGMISFPYLLVYEVLGPWFEAEGTLVFLASLALGMVGVPMLLLMLAATVLLGLAVSLFSFAIAERRRGFFPGKDRFLLVLYAVAESFGFRQLMSLLRVRGFVRMLGRVGGWGRMERRGFGDASPREAGA